MARNTRDYFRYYPASPEFDHWGLGVTASGFASIPPQASYPPLPHPEDHQFDWAHGRVLDSLQVVLILAGGGTLETKPTGRRRVKAGMVFLLLPQLWHRYRPDRKTGWEESWIEVQGPVVEKLLQVGMFSPAMILRRGAIDIGLDDVLEKIHHRAREGTIGFVPELSAAALQVLALCSQIGVYGGQMSPIQKTIRQAERYFSDHHHENINMEVVARKLGVGYSHFRRAFRTHTGFAPWQYVKHLRLTRARRLLSSSNAKLDEVAARIGFNSGFHLSLAFKQAYGISPAHWRKSVETS